MCANFLELKDTLRILHDQKFDYLHFDVMDGSLYPDYMMSNKLLADIHAVSTLRHDYHLMIRQPDKYIDLLKTKPGDIINIHYELCGNIPDLLEKIRRKGCQAGLAINALTPVDVLNDYYDKIDVAFVMLTDAGRMGNQFQHQCLEKVHSIRQKAQHFNVNLDIEVDGSVHAETIPLLKQAGATIFVGGSSGLFLNNTEFSLSAQRFQSLVRQA